MKRKPPRGSRSAVSLVYEYRDNALWLSGPVKEKAAQNIVVDVECLKVERVNIARELEMVRAFTLTVLTGT